MSSRARSGSSTMISRSGGCSSARSGGPGFAVEGFDGGNGVHARLRLREPDAIISDIRMPDVDGLELLGEITARYPHLPVVIMTGYSDLDSAVSAYQGGAYEYLPKPFDLDEAVALITRAVTHNRENTSRGPGTSVTAAPGIIGSAPAMQEVFRAIGRLSRSNLTVLITGESGTGKELVARALHRHSPRAARAFIALNTARDPRDLLESELFGHERGAFTGAQSRRLGRFEQADGGTLLLDEIGDMPAELQTRLLRVLADGEFYRVGGHVPVRVDVRIIAATHQDLEARVRNGTLPGGSLPSSQRHPGALAGVTGTPGGHPAAACALPRSGGERDRGGAEDIEARGGALPEDTRMARQRSSDRERMPLADGDGVRQRDPSRGSSAGAARRRRRCRRRHG